jgi:hypothetical protein
VTSIELSFVRSVADCSLPSSSWVRKPENSGAVVLSELAISLEAKNARTITMRIGNAALLKNLLIGYRRATRTQGCSNWTRC